MERSLPPLLEVPAMPSFERLHRSLALHLAKGDPVEQARLQHGFRQRDRGRLEVAALFVSIYILFVIALQAGGGIACAPTLDNRRHTINQLAH